MEPHRPPAATLHTHPSLALVKYWGKSARGHNRPLTPSLAMNINRLTTSICVWRCASADEERVMCDGEETPRALFRRNYRPFLAHCRARFRRPRDFWRVQIDNDYPLAAGLASSSAIYAGIALAINAALGGQEKQGAVSAIARYGSASAARAVFGGVACLPARAHRAYCYAPPHHWPELRLIVARCAAGQKPISSREAMRHSKSTSPLFAEWRRRAPRWYREARIAMRARDLERLGGAMQQSYLTMFATMHTACPPIFYWEPQSIAIIKEAQRLRKSGVAVWETMDAGPQVKLLTLAAEVPGVLRALHSHLPPNHCIVSELGGGWYAAE